MTAPVCAGRPHDVTGFVDQVRCNGTELDAKHPSHDRRLGGEQKAHWIRFVYYQRAKSCGIDMMPSRLLKEGNRRHFDAPSFDRKDNQKIHFQTLHGPAHVDCKKPGSYFYAELFCVARQLRLSAKDAAQLLSRIVFNILATVHDDQITNRAVMLVDKHGSWHQRTNWPTAINRAATRWTITG